MAPQHLQPPSTTVLLSFFLRLPFNCLPPRSCFAPSPPPSRPCSPQERLSFSRSSFPPFSLSLLPCIAAFDSSVKPCLTVICSHIVSTILSRRTKPRKRMCLLNAFVRIPVPIRIPVCRESPASILQLAVPLFLFAPSPSLSSLSSAPSIYNRRERGPACIRCYAGRIVLFQEDLRGTERAFREGLGRS